MEAYTFFKLTGNPFSLDVLDLACGEGFYTRQFKLRGAASVTRINISEEMIRLAREEEDNNPIGAMYSAQDVLMLDLPKSLT